MEILFLKLQYLNHLKKSYRCHVRNHAINKEGLFKVTIIDSPMELTKEQNELYYELYLSTASRGLEINTFRMPKDIIDIAINYYFVPDGY